METTQTTDQTVNEVLPPNLTPEELQDVKDNATIFLLAGAFIKLYKAIVTKNQREMNNIMINAGNVLRQDPTFQTRFAELQRQVMEEYNDSKPVDTEERVETQLITPTAPKIIIP